MKTHTPSSNISAHLPDALLLWTLAMLVIPAAALSVTESLSLAGRLANFLFPLGAFGVWLSCSRKIGVTVLTVFPFMVLGAFQIVLLFLYGRSIIAVDMFLNVVTTNPTEVGELLGNLLSAILTVCLMYLPSLFLAIAGVSHSWRISQSVRSGVRRMSLVALIAALTAIAVSLPGKRPVRPLLDIYPVDILYNIVLAVDRTERIGDYSLTSSHFSAGAFDRQPADSVRRVVVIVVGETARGDRWQSNGYDRPTSPQLAEGGFISFPDAYSESNTTHKSVPMLLSHLDADTFGDSIYSVKSIITAFREAGFRTAFFSNQRYNRSFIDYFGNEADTTLFIKEQPGSAADRYDMELLPLLRDELSLGHNRQLIVLHTYGSHFSYVDRYPESFARFTPDSYADASLAAKARLDNAYDNTIFYTAAMLDSVAGCLNALDAESAMVYASDHGEDIFDDDRHLFLHASPVPSRWQIDVPLILWMSDRLSARHPEYLQAAGANTQSPVSTSRSVYHTAMQLGAVGSPLFDPSLSVVSGGYKKPARRYLNDHNRAVDLDALLAQ